MIYEMLSGVNPYKLKMKNAFDKMSMINDVEIEMLPTFSEEATSLLTGLLQKKPKKRLGYNGPIEIKTHPFFKPIDFDALLKKKIHPEFRPQMSSNIDLQNIDKAFTREAPEETPE